jgi:hypothetical protein
MKSKDAPKEISTEFSSPIRRTSSTCRAGRETGGECWSHALGVARRDSGRFPKTDRIRSIVQNMNRRELIQTLGAVGIAAAVPRIQICDM